MPEHDPVLLARTTQGRWSRWPSRGVTGFSIDSRTTAPGDLFVALRTSRRDGHDFIGDAAARGAAAALVAEFRESADLPQLLVPDTRRALQEIGAGWRRGFRGPVVGITGSAGKTSTKELLGRLLGGEPDVLVTEGNLNNHLGVPLTLLRLDPAVHRAAVVEAGLSVPGDIEEVAPLISADHGIITLIAPAHLEGMGTVEAIAREKAALLRHARAGGFAVMPRSAAEFATLFEHGLSSVVVSPMPAGEAPRKASEHVVFSAVSSEEATRLTLAGPGVPERSFVAPPLSPGQAQNAVLALVLAGKLGVGDAQLAERLAGWRPAKLRGQTFPVPGGFLYLDSYNANPASVVDALAHFAVVAPPSLRRLVVLGSMGELGRDSARLHEETGRQVRLRPGDRFIAVGDNAVDLARGALEAGADGTSILCLADAGALPPILESFRGSVLLKGSRRWALETALPGTPFEPREGGKVPC